MRTNGTLGDPTDYGQRQTRPEYYNSYASGLGIVPRRGWDAQTSSFLSILNGSMEGQGNPPPRVLRWWASAYPLVVLGALCQSHPLAQMALSNDLSLAFAPGDTRIEAVASEADKDADPDGTAAIEALWQRLPADTGGMTGLQWTLGEQLSVAGLSCAEAVPAANGSGLLDVATFSPLSVRFVDEAGIRYLEQEQSGTEGGWRRLDPLTCFATPWRGSRDNPYGLPRYAAFLPEGLADTAENKDLRDVMHAVAWPHLTVEFPWAEMITFATEKAEELLIGRGTDGGDLTALEWATTAYVAFKAKMATMRADDLLIMPNGAKASMLQADMDGIEEPLKLRRLRVILSLDQLPNLMGVTEGGTQAYAQEQSRVYYNKLESLRSKVNAILVKVANLHLRLLGLPLVARAKVEPIQTRDRLSVAQAREIEIRNAEALVNRGYLSDNEASMELTGSEPVDPARAQAAYDRQNVTAPSPANNPAPGGGQGNQ